MPVDKTWTSQIRRSSKSLETSTFLRRSLTTTSILEMTEELFIQHEPDLVVFQVGIVDCVRRALPRKLLKVCSPIPVFGTFLHLLSNKYHFVLTQSFEFKEVS
jgi:hypothetical protein